MGYLQCEHCSVWRKYDNWRRPIKAIKHLQALPSNGSLFWTWIQQTPLCKENKLGRYLDNGRQRGVDRQKRSWVNIFMVRGSYLGLWVLIKFWGLGAVVHCLGSKSHCLGNGRVGFLRITDSYTTRRLFCVWPPSACVYLLNYCCRLSIANSYCKRWQVRYGHLHCCRSC